MIIGLTGGICSGKTKISNYLSELGARIIDADEVAREIVKPKSAVLDELAKHFGSDILHPDGTLNRSKLASIVFSNPTALQKLNQITHPLILKIIADKIEEHRKKKNREILVLSAPLLIETGLHKLVDKVWVVNVDLETQIKRLMARDKLTRAEALKRINSQLPASERLKFADEVIDNSGCWNDTRIQVLNLWNKYKL